MSFQRRFGIIVIIVIAIIVITVIGLIFPSENTLTIIVGAAGVFVSGFTYFFQRKQLKSRTLMDLFKDLNLPSHREARRIIFGGEEGDG